MSTNSPTEKKDSNIESKKEKKDTNSSTPSIDTTKTIIPPQIQTSIDNTNIQIDPNKKKKVNKDKSDSKKQKPINTVPTKTISEESEEEKEEKKQKEFQIKLNSVRKQVIQQEIPKPLPEMNKKKTISILQSKKKMNIQLKGDKMITVDPETDPVFTFLCRGYDEGLKQPCYRTLGHLTFRQTINFTEFIERFGCLCREKMNHEIVLDQQIIQIEKDLPIKIKQFNTEFMNLYYNDYKMNSVSNVIDDPKNSSIEVPFEEQDSDTSETESEDDTDTEELELEDETKSDSDDSEKEPENI